MEKAIDLLVKLLPVLVAIAGGLWALFTYIDHADDARRSEERTRLVEVQRPYLEKQTALYFEAAQVAGQIATADGSGPEWEGARKRFWQLYWSELSMVESHQVEIAMGELGKSLKSYDAAVALAASAAKDAEVAKAHSGLQRDALELAHAIRNSIWDSWGVTAGR